MGNLALAYFNRVRPGVATVTGGSWLAAFPASNVADVDRSKPARSTTAGTSDTKLNIDLGAAYPIRLIMLDAHNLSDAGQFKVKLGTSSGASDLYSGSFVNWLQVTDAESAITEYGASKGRDFPGICLLASTITARYVTVEFSDASNTAGHLDIGYLYAGPALLPAVNPEYGAWSDGWMDNSTSTRTPGGDVISTPLGRYKMVQLTLGALTQAEGDTVHEIQRVLGTVGRVGFIADVDDMAKSQRYGFIGTLRALELLDNPEFHRRGNAFVIDQG